MTADGNLIVTLELEAGKCVSLSIPASELAFVCTRASGPGGQYVNRTDSAVQLRFNVMTSGALNDEVRQRLLKLCRNQISSDGWLLVEASENRSQALNKQLALNKLRDLLAKVLRRPKPRKRTRPTKASVERRLHKKKMRSDLKRTRRGDD